MTKSVIKKKELSAALAELTSNASPAKLLGLDANNAPVSTSVADVAQVVGGLKPIGRLGSQSDIDNALTTGIYLVEDKLEATFSNGILVVFAYSKDIVNQIFFSADAIMQHRINWYGRWIMKK